MRNSKTRSKVRFPSRTRRNFRPSRSEERRVGKSVDHCVTGVQTCALPISDSLDTVELIMAFDEEFKDEIKGEIPESDAEKLQTVEIGRASCRKECRSLCDWSSDVCSSDL